MLKLNIIGDVRSIFSGELVELQDTFRIVTEDVGQHLQATLRQQVRAAGLGELVANAWRLQIFPKQASRKSFGVKARVFTKAADIITGFDEGAVIRAKNGARFLAIPLADVPRKRGVGRGGTSRMTPDDVETAFNQDLHFMPWGRGRPGGYLYLRNVTRGRRGGLRVTTTERRRQGREAEIVPMFILIPAARLQKKLDLEVAASSADRDIVSRLAARLT